VVVDPDVTMNNKVLYNSKWGSSYSIYKLISCFVVFAAVVYWFALDIALFDVGQLFLDVLRGYAPAFGASCGETLNLIPLIYVNF
jgi:hypothetical protein